MRHPPSPEDLDTAPRHQALVIREGLAFTKEWPYMEASVQFFLRWKKIVADDSKEWLTNYLKMLNAFIKSGVKFDSPSTLEFSILNSEKSSRLKLNYELPPNVDVDDSKGFPEVIMVNWKQ